MIDRYGRNIYYARISVTERCNYRCKYCYIPSKYSKELTLEDFKVIFKVLSALGITKVRITGGEPTVRNDIVQIIRYACDFFEEVYMTTNGHFLENLVEDLKKAGIKGINVSLDTLDPIKFKNLTEYGDLKKVLRGIEKSVEMGIKIKINTVLLKSNKDEIIDLIKYARKLNIPIRFIEQMPFGNYENFLSESEALDIIEKHFGKLKASSIKLGEGPARYFKLNNIYVGFISSISKNFCATCNKIRINSKGKLIPCLGRKIRIDFSSHLNDESKLKEIFEKAIYNKPFKHNFLSERFKEGMNTIGG